MAQRGKIIVDISDEEDDKPPTTQKITVTVYGRYFRRVRVANRGKKYKIEYRGRIINLNRSFKLM